MSYYNNFDYRDDCCYNGYVSNPTITDTFYALDSNNNILSVTATRNNQGNYTQLGDSIRCHPITGLNLGQRAVGIAFRPANRTLYLLVRTQTGGRLYTLNISNKCGAIATPIGPVLITAGGAPIVLNGTSFSISFNPTVDRLRVVSNTGQNLTVNPDTGVTIINTNLSYAVGDVNFGNIPSIGGVAYTNNFVGATNTTLYGIDTNQNALVIQNPPNEGTLNTVGSLGINVSQFLGFSIVNRSNTAISVLRTGTQTGIYGINLLTGTAILLRRIVPNECNNGIIIGLAAVPSNRV
ncbi:lipoprotein [Moumouvirus goulette]|uniref:Lipoprotein n=1 Tax=Moumouvirus goulette TaxID=1247379 RepID=M1PFW9_9VIRU|nr:lipoprotein [Moumouvirus goulette]AGF84888.1 lipoprotein [Moumouvirus goulette]